MGDVSLQKSSKVCAIVKWKRQTGSQGALHLAKIFRFEVLKIFGVKREGFFHAGENLAISLVDGDGARS